MIKQKCYEKWILQQTAGGAGQCGGRGLGSRCASRVKLKIFINNSEENKCIVISRIVEDIWPCYTFIKAKNEFSNDSEIRMVDLVRKSILCIKVQRIDIKTSALKYS